MPVEHMIQIGSSQRVVGRICKEDFQMSRQSLETLREFLLSFQEEIVLSDSSGDDKPSPGKSIDSQDI